MVWGATQSNNCTSNHTYSGKCHRTQCHWPHFQWDWSDQHHKQIHYSTIFVHLIPNWLLTIVYFISSRNTYIVLSAVQLYHNQIHVERKMEHFSCHKNSSLAPTKIGFLMWEIAMDDNVKISNDVSNSSGVVDLNTRVFITIKHVFLMLTVQIVKWYYRWCRP